MKYISMFSGIEAASVAWEPLGFEAVAYAEIDKFPSAVLAHRFPNVPNLGDITKAEWGKYAGTVNIIIGGSPCQSFSVAGLRKGLEDPRGNLMLEYLRACDAIKPEWIVWENVPGVLSSNGGRDFGAFIGAMEQLGYGWAYRVLDAQYFGVAQRRRRVYFVANRSGDWRGPAAVLFNREVMCGDTTQGEGTGKGTPESSSGGAGSYCYQDVVGTLCARDYKGVGSQYVKEDKLVICTAPNFSKREEQQLPTRDDGISYALTTGSPPNVCYSLQDVLSVLKEQNGAGFNDSGIAYTLTTRGEQGVCYDDLPRVMATGSANAEIGVDLAPTLLAHNQKEPPILQHRKVVRRLTPEECEALQGFPRGWTKIPYRGKSAEECPDGPRYKAIGNSMAVPVVRWVGQGIKDVEEYERGIR